MKGNNMTPEKQRIAIAKACGENESCPPDYLNDLNAITSAMKVLWRIDELDRYIFNDHLANILRGRIVNRNEWDAETLLDATAENLCEALLRTLNIWEDES
jgi:hypothetical protein